MVELWLWNSRCRYMETQLTNWTSGYCSESNLRKCPAQCQHCWQLRQFIHIFTWSYSASMGKHFDHLPESFTPCYIAMRSPSRCFRIAGFVLLWIHCWTVPASAASNGCSVTTTTTTATWHIKGEIESCWTPGAYWVSFFNDVIFAMQDLDIWIKNLHRTAVAEARGSNFHVFYWWNFAEVRFAGFHDFVFYISYGFGKSVHILCGSFAEA